ncbi:MAG: hypothetical protein K2Y30_14270 [Flavobacteriaceae bacterium]|jgi:hypothetical protein|uniref:Transmembrane anchor protein n=1 Tax=Flavobacterium cellulosilyticum TaxID=2541731 RepID=A0A4R5CHB1_9FLAO|nr:hypothetical protein [Flavobacterium cellulosilyticum]MBX9889090.1 hypothetical protein [Flavobacteriaceae bacterium]TDD97900.1 hypothetical protein E0F76_07305 [Flavobacterium cellulosilyticum]|tara:strand:- start:1526 stop:2152 length:627 start_codon:yes stop_codon:yes gene_type:complete
MSEINHQIVEKKEIIKAVLFALVLGIIILVSAVLPAEYGIDPIGTGKLFGFSKLYVPENAGENQLGQTTQETFPLIKMEKAGSGPDVKRPVEADNPAPEKQYAEREDTVEVIVPAGKGIEYKIYMLKYGKMKYEWTTDKGTVYLDFHGEVKQEKAVNDVYFESYTLAYSNNMVGTFYAPFEGKHGWFFKNNENTAITVTLKLNGQYSM